MRVGVRFPMFVVALVMVLGVRVRVPVTFLVLFMRVHRAFVDAEFDSLDVLPLLALEVHVEIAKFELGKLPLQRARLHPEVAQRPHGHVAADAGGAI